MSEVKTNETQGTEKTKFEIKVDNHPKFNYLYQSAIWDSTELCQVVNSVFKQVYADWEGSTFELIPGTANFMCCLHFNHRNTDGSPMPNACTMQPTESNIRSSVVQGRRSMDQRNRDGDKYYLTEEGKKGIAKFIQDNPSLVNKDGSYKWDKIVIDEAEQENAFNAYGAPRLQYTKVSFIDPNKILQEVFGGVDENGNKLCYNIRLIGAAIPAYSQANGSNNQIFRIAVDVISENNLAEYANKNGFAGMFSRLNIVR